MKVQVIVVAILCAFSFEVTQGQVLEGIAHELQQRITQLLPFFVLTKLEEFVIEPQFQIIPDLPDPLILDNFGFRIDEDSEIGEEVYGELSVCNSSVLGLSTLSNQLDIIGISLGTLTFQFFLNTEKLSFHGLYDADFTIYEGDYVTTGSGNISAEIDELALNVIFVLNIFKTYNRISIHEIDIVDLSFESIELFGEDFIVNGELFDWDALNSNLKPSFDAIWPDFKPTVENIVKTEVNSIVSDCKVFDLLNEEFACFTGTGNRNGGILQRAISSVQFSNNRRVCPPIRPEPEDTTTSSPTTTTTTTEITTTSTEDPDNAASLSEFKPILLLVVLVCNFLN